MTDKEFKREYERVRAESERLLKDEPTRARAVPPPVREVPIPEIDPVQEWREWHDARDREREAAKAALRSEREMRSPERAAIDALSAEIGALRRDHDALASASNEQATALIEYSDVVNAKLNALAALADRLERTLEAAKTARESLVESFRSQLDLVTRQNEYLDQQLTTARREADVATGRRESQRTRDAVQRVADVIKLK